MRAGRLLLAAIASMAIGCAVVAWLNVRGEEPVEPDATTTLTPAAVIERGAYLARAGNCMGCHTTAGGASFAGGRGIDTPFGVVYAPNITPDTQSGIGRWSSSAGRGNSAGPRTSAPARG